MVGGNVVQFTLTMGEKKKKLDMIDDAVKLHSPVPYIQARVLVMLGNRLFILIL